MKHLFIVTVCVVWFASGASAADTWVQVKSPNFTVVSNAGGHRASDVAREYERIRAAINTLCPWARVQLNRPVTIIAVKNEAGLKALAPAFWEKSNQAKPGSVYTSGGDRHYIALRTDLTGNEQGGLPSYSSAYASYTALALEFSYAHGLPLWMVTGLSAVMSNARVYNDQIEYGRDITVYVTRFLTEPRLHVAALDAVTRESPYYANEATRSRYTAQSWALMHYILFGDPTESGGKANELARVIMSGVKPLEAIEKVYGSTTALESRYTEYIQRGVFRYGQVPADPAIPKSFAATPLTAADASLVRGGFYVATGRLKEARAMIAEARGTQPDTRIAYELEGMIADQERQPEAAGTAYAKAADLNSDNFYVNFRLASLTWRPNSTSATLDQVQKYAGRAVALNEAYGPAYTLLANVLTALNKADNAIPLAERAIDLEPNQVAPRLADASALWKLSRREDALRAARTALPLARDDAQSHEVQSLLASFTNNANVTSPTQRGSAPAVEAPREIKPEGTGMPNGPVGGVIGGVVGGLPAAPPPPTGPVRVGGSISQPRKLKDVPPVYPTIAQSAKVTGTVVLQATISPRGDVSDAKVLRSIPLLDAAALEAVRQWQFAPTLLNGVAVPVIMTVTVNFTLGDDPAALERDCSAGKMEECRRLAVTLRSGSGVPPDPVKARGLFQRACDGSIASACQSLASMYVAGEGGIVDLSSAAKIDRKGCDANDSAACTSLARLTYTGQGVTKNVQDAIGLYERAIGASQRGCDGHDPSSCTDLTFIATLYQAGRDAPRNVERALAMYRTACDKQSAEACGLLGVATSTGSGVPKEVAAAAALLQQACPASLGSVPEDMDRASMVYAVRVQACGSLGEFYEKGIGVPVSRPQAITLYQRACSAQQVKGIALSRLPDRCADATRLQIKPQLPPED